MRSERPGIGISIDIGVGVGVDVAPRSTPSAAATTALPSPAGTAAPDLALASRGAIVVLGTDLSLSIVDARGRSTPLAAAGESAPVFPAWSPDGTRIAAVAGGSPESVVVFDARVPATGETVEPVAIFRRPDAAPFYLSWAPEGRDVAFLATESGDLSLRIAPADGDAPLDGSGPGATIRVGNPFYFDWIEPDRLVAHIGGGGDDFLGEIGLDGAPLAPELEAPGIFRSVVASPDRASVGFVRLADDGSGQVVAVARDGSNEHAMPVFGAAAVAFHPGNRWLAAIGPSELPAEPVGFPFGPLRLLDAASGDVRTLLDGNVFGFWWSPDGATVAALRLQPAGPIALANAAAAAPEPASDEVRLLFVDVTTGNIRSESVVRLSGLFVERVLPYFDQYALSHRLWSPDSTSFLLPVVRDGAAQIAVMFAGGDPPIMLDGAIGFWSP